MILIASLMCALVLGEDACGNPSELGTVVPVQGVRVTPQTVHFAAIGETQQLLAVVSPANATDQALLWESTDSTVATVNAAGQVTARALALTSSSPPTPTTGTISLLRTSASTRKRAKTRVHGHAVRVLIQGPLDYRLTGR